MQIKNVNTRALQLYLEMNSPCFCDFFREWTPTPVDLLLPLTCQKHLPAVRTTPHEPEEHCVLCNVFVCLTFFFFFLLCGSWGGVCSAHVRTSPKLWETALCSCGLSSLKGTIGLQMQNLQGWDTFIYFLTTEKQLSKLLKVLKNHKIHSFSISVSSGALAHPCSVCWFHSSCEYFQSCLKHRCVCMSVFVIAVWQWSVRVLFQWHRGQQWCCMFLVIHI